MPTIVSLRSRSTSLESNSTSGRFFTSLSRLQLHAAAMMELTMDGPRASFSRRPWYD